MSKTKSEFERRLDLGQPWDAFFGDACNIDFAAMAKDDHEKEIGKLPVVRELPSVPTS